MEYEYKRLDENQVGSIRELMRLVYGNAPSAASLATKYRTGPFGAEYVGYLAYPQGNSDSAANSRIPAAFYGVFPISLRCGDREILAAQSGDTMTHPEHRGKGLFIELANRTYALAQEEGIELVFGFPNQNSFPGFKRKLNWTFPYTMLQFVRYVPTLPIGLIRKLLVNEPRGFSPYARRVVARVFDVVQPEGSLWEPVRSDGCAVVRDGRFYSYKASSGLFVRLGEAGIALKYDGDLIIGEIMGDPSLSEMRFIMRRLDMVAALMGINRIRSFFSPNSHVHRELAPLGRCSASLPFGYLNFRSDFDPSRIEFSYIDYDTF